MQPSTGGLSWFSSISIVFWPGAILTGPYLKCSVWTPLCADGGGREDGEGHEQRAERERDADGHDAASMVGSAAAAVHSASAITRSSMPGAWTATSSSAVVARPGARSGGGGENSTAAVPRSSQSASRPSAPVVSVSAPVASASSAQTPTPGLQRRERERVLGQRARGEAAVQQPVDDELLERRPRDVRVEPEVAEQDAVGPRHRPRPQRDRLAAAQPVGVQREALAQPRRRPPRAARHARGPDPQPGVLGGDQRVDRGRDGLGSRALTAAAAPPPAPRARRASSASSSAPTCVASDPAARVGEHEQRADRAEAVEVADDPVVVVADRHGPAARPHALAQVVAVLLLGDRGERHAGHACRAPGRARRPGPRTPPRRSPRTRARPGRARPARTS